MYSMFSFYDLRFYLLILGHFVRNATLQIRKLFFSLNNFGDSSTLIVFKFLPFGSTSLGNCVNLEEKYSLTHSLRQVGHEVAYVISKQNYVPPFPTTSF